MNTRELVRADADWVCGLIVENMRSYIAAAFGEWDEAKERAQFHERFFYLPLRALRVDGRDVGIIQTEPGRGTWYLSNLQIRKDLQRRGLGTAALELFLAEARQRGLPAELQVFRVNPAQRLYRRLGFSVVRETRAQLLMLNRSTVSTATSRRATR